ncbi:tRNA (adenosine(37)-N6)-threonylcarbamoyltransferase complex ATPase subunit type 1 TsaE [Staphylococcus felis]|uniref:tRNA threonylcarbamoyladenosine biosynthesis protein TsaE n=2 Tax=Staphylococcus felis TaxID=46127 RepID=A0A2K3ZJ39_9STAP|nr:tRNA (adenosine(37)-N6)-threonylcarbamoyltransferase complex ATPase subunit type 1 TsaE [Staphylococcus felis]AVP37575.1 tRNA (adenosine(37)-N6)-threonylcarbamoyltransferase complex ATPase subunit type 1 TsaE [Staphylococcus felis]MBH9580554.1 tRNA (adenosine(37)-N6)-threonylcarbamoyltransferase complex ATPase subunit type 1 TsaE [Staphylococcus felis]MDM8328019.1 tRNA (adenosine(37)-N6)-threonylcarbamoyltransferase complex ATPase subunit type 1 TsaE [Staphylococcus felis]PNZ37896.1 tRNA (ad
MIKIKNLKDMQQFANHLVSFLKAKDVILLDGNLGAGKTTLSQFIGRELGVKRTINSPTFNIIKSYKGDSLNFHHMDCYRLEDSDEDLGFDEYFNDNAVTVIEWSQFIEPFLPEDFLKISIDVVNEDERMISLSAHGEHYLAVKEALDRV